MADTKRTALITGSGQNIGRAIALHLGERGYQIIVNGSSNRDACDSVVKEITTAGGTAMVAMGNIGERSDALGIVQAGLDSYGSIDVLVNNAAIRPSAPFLEIDDDEWRRIMDVDFMSTVWLARACLPGMIDKGWGRIITFSGRNAMEGAMGRPHVASAKHATLGLTKSLAREFGRHGITTNMISPGIIVGEVADTGIVGARYDQFKAETPVGHLGRPDNIASMVDLLVSDDADFLNGQMLQINGGVVS